MPQEFTNIKIVQWEVGSVVVVTGGNASERRTHSSLLKKMEGLSR